jgi:protein gp37
VELGTTERGDDMNPTGIEYGQVAWNPVTGCSKVSEACINCWAERMSKRLAGRCGYSKDNPFKVTMHPERLEEPLKWRKPRTVLVSFMGDLFHEDVDVKTLATVFGIMAACPHHTFMVLTKRPADMARFFEELTTRANGKSMMEVFLGDDTNWRCRHILRAAALRATGNGRVATQDLEGWPIPNIWLGRNRREPGSG